MTTALTFATALWVFVGALIGLGIGFVLAKSRYRKKYKQEHSNVLNCATFWPSSKAGGNRLHVFAVATHQTNELHRLVRSFNEIGGVPIEIIGLGCKWQGFGNKPLWLKEKILQSGLRPDDIVLFTDAYDVVCQADLSTLVPKFRSFNKPLVFGAERGCHPNSSLADQFPQSPTSMRYTNSGGFVGYAGEILRMIDQSGIRPHEDDQEMACQYTIRYPDRVGLDYRAEIFLNLFDLKANDLEFVQVVGTKENRAYRWRETGSMPLILHGNGPAKNLLSTIHSN